MNHSNIGIFLTFTTKRYFLALAGVKTPLIQHNCKQVKQNGRHANSKSKWIYKMIRNVALGTISLNNVAGGLERNIIFLANRLSELGFKVYLYSFDCEVESSFYPISPEVNWVRLGVSRPHQKASIWEKLETVAKLRAAIIRHDIDSIICFSHGLLPRFILVSLFLQGYLQQKFCVATKTDSL